MSETKDKIEPEEETTKTEKGGKEEKAGAYKVFKSAYSENPKEFKKEFEAGIKDKIISKIEAKKVDIIANANEPDVEETETEEETTETETDK